MTNPCCRSAALRERAACVRVLKGEIRRVADLDTESHPFNFSWCMQWAVDMIRDSRRAADARKARRKRT